MEQLRSVRKWGNSWVIVLTSPDVKDRKIEEGNIYEADISKITLKLKKEDNDDEKRIDRVRA